MNVRALKFSLPLIFFVLLAYFLWRGLALDPRNLPSMLIGKPVPYFVENRFSDDRLSFGYHDFNNKPTLLVFWASWCHVCEKEQTFLLNKKKDPRIAIWGINYKDEPDLARTWLKKIGDPFERLDSDPNGKIALEFGVYGTPESFFIDKRGSVRFRHAGELTAEIWNQSIEPLLSKEIS